MAEAVRMPAGPQVRQWASKNRFDEWMVGRFVAVAERAGLGSADRLHFLDALRRKVPSYIRTNALRTTPKALITRLEARGFRLAPTKMDPAVLRIDEAPISQGATLEHLLGWSSPQDLASAAAPMALGARSDETVADLAAAPGMKTIHIAGDMRDAGALVAVEPDAQRMRALRMNLERAGASCTLLRQHDAQSLPGQAWADRVLVDAPCTGEGTLPKDKTRRHGRIEETGRMSRLQEDIVDAADRILRPGGVMVYATCTFAPEENEAQVARLLQRGYRMEPTGLDACEGVPLGHGVTDWPGMELPDEIRLARRFFPGIHPTLGFFLARLRKEERMIRRATQDEVAVIRGSLEAVQRGLYEAFLSGKQLAMVEERPASGAINSGAETGARDHPAQASGASAVTPGDAPRERAAPPQPAEASESATPAPGAPAPRRIVVLVDAAVLALPPELLNGAFGGLQVGVLEDGFALDLQGAIIMARETRRQTIRVNEKATRLFLYGRSIIGTSILQFDSSLRRGDHCIVTNPRHEALGIGVVVGNFKAPRTAVDAVHDLGSYLRDE